MIQRYSRAKMRDIWTEQRKLEIWLQIELLAAEALVAEGLVPKADFEQMKAKASFNVERCKELEKTLNHDVIAFTTNVAENIGAPASRWLHFGLTSSDVVDTAFAVQMVQSADLLIEDVHELRKVVAAKARKYQFTPMIGRSHGIHAEPTTFGLKMALMYDEFARALRRLENARTAVAIGKLSGAVGTSAHLSLRSARASNVGPLSSGTCNALRCSKPRNTSHRAKKAPAPCRTNAIPLLLNGSPVSLASFVGMRSPRWKTSRFGTSATSATALSNALSFPIRARSSITCSRPSRSWWMA
jgi:argininosuccinate lyase